MVGYYVLFGFLLVMFGVSLYLSNWEVFAPAPLFSIGMLASVTLAVAGMGSWNAVELGSEPVLVVILGSASFCFGSCLVYGRLRLVRRGCLDSKDDVGTIGCESVSGGVRLWKYIPLVAIVLIALFIRVSETFEIAASLGVQGGYAECAAAVRKATVSFLTADATKFGVGFSFIERQLEQLVTAIGYVGSYLFARSLVREGEKRREVVISGLLFLLVGCFALSKGGRGEIIMYVIAVVAVWYTLKLREVEDTRAFTLRVILACAALAALLAGVLYATGALVGRKAGSGFIEYITFYFGGSVPSLQILLDQGAPVIEPGIRTFYGISNLAYKFSIVDALPSYSIAWVDAGGHGSNIFTCFARYYLDYGYLGVGVLSLFAGALMAAVYRAARGSNAVWLVAIVGMLSPYIFDMAREEFVFSRLLSIHMPVTIALIALIALFATRPVAQDVKRIACRLVNRSEVSE